MTEIPRRNLAPVEGGRVRKPDGTLLAQSGEPVVWSTYWARRLMHGDVVDLDAAPAAAPIAATIAPAIAKGDVQ